MVLTVIFTLIVVGVLLYWVNAYVTMDPKFKGILNTVVVLVTIWWLLKVFGVLGRIG